ncbi:unnamed protein product [Amoebophrya sp. A120]|nr:unnamed protein product [Amoebophrya sp. A120]|eukprot:GSA120T00008312001.1
MPTSLPPPEQERSAELPTLLRGTHDGSQHGHSSSKTTKTGATIHPTTSAGVFGKNQLLPPSVDATTPHPITEEPVVPPAALRLPIRHMVVSTPEKIAREFFMQPTPDIGDLVLDVEQEVLEEEELRLEHERTSRSPTVFACPERQNISSTEQSPDRKLSSDRTLAAAGGFTPTLLQDWNTTDNENKDTTEKNKKKQQEQLPRSSSLKKKTNKFGTVISTPGATISKTHSTGQQHQNMKVSQPIQKRVSFSEELFLQSIQYLPTPVDGEEDGERVDSTSEKIFTIGEMNIKAHSRAVRKEDQTTSSFGEAEQQERQSNKSIRSLSPSISPKVRRGRGYAHGRNSSLIGDMGEDPMVEEDDEDLFLDQLGAAAAAAAHEQPRSEQLDRDLPHVVDKELVQDQETSFSAVPTQNLYEPLDQVEDVTSSGACSLYSQEQRSLDDATICAAVDTLLPISTAALQSSATMDLEEEWRIDAALRKLARMQKQKRPSEVDDAVLIESDDLLSNSSSSGGGNFYATSDSSSDDFGFDGVNVDHAGKKKFSKLGKIRSGAETSKMVNSTAKVVEGLMLSGLNNSIPTLDLENTAGEPQQLQFERHLLDDEGPFLSNTGSSLSPIAHTSSFPEAAAIMATTSTTSTSYNPWEPSSMIGEENVQSTTTRTISLSASPECRKSGAEYLANFLSTLENVDQDLVQTLFPSLKSSGSCGRNKDGAEITTLLEQEDEIDYDDLNKTPKKRTSLAGMRPVSLSRSPKKKPNCKSPKPEILTEIRSFNELVMPNRLETLIPEGRTGFEMIRAEKKNNQKDHPEEVEAEQKESPSKTAFPAESMMKNVVKTTLPPSSSSGAVVFPSKSHADKNVVLVRPAWETFANSPMDGEQGDVGRIVGSAGGESNENEAEVLAGNDDEIEKQRDQKTMGISAKPNSTSCSSPTKNHVALGPSRPTTNGDSKVVVTKTTCAVGAPSATQIQDTSAICAKTNTAALSKISSTAKFGTTSGILFQPIQHMKCLDFRPSLGVAASSARARGPGAQQQIISSVTMNEMNTADVVPPPPAASGFSSVIIPPAVVMNRTNYKYAFQPGFRTTTQVNAKIQSSVPVPPPQTRKLILTTGGSTTTNPSRTTISSSFPAQHGVLPQQTSKNTKTGTTNIVKKLMQKEQNYESATAVSDQHAVTAKLLIPIDASATAVGVEQERAVGTTMQKSLARPTMQEIQTSGVAGKTTVTQTLIEDNVCKHSQSLLADEISNHPTSGEQQPVRRLTRTKVRRSITPSKNGMKDGGISATSRGPSLVMNNIKRGSPTTCGSPKEAPMPGGSFAGAMTTSNTTPVKSSPGNNYNNRSTKSSPKVLRSTNSARKIKDTNAAAVAISNKTLTSGRTSFTTNKQSSPSPAKIIASSIKTKSPPNSAGLHHHIADGASTTDAVMKMLHNNSEDQESPPVNQQNINDTITLSSRVEKPRASCPTAICQPQPPKLPAGVVGGMLDAENQYQTAAGVMNRSASVCSLKTPTEIANKVKYQLPRKFLKFTPLPENQSIFFPGGLPMPNCRGGLLRTGK